jgi:hypothetical protein
MAGHPIRTIGRNVAATALAGVVLGSLLFGGASAVGAAPAGGAIQVFVTPNNTGGGPIVITGAIGDFGTTQTINKNGTPNPNGDFVTITLKKGTFEVNVTTLNALANKMQPTVNPMTCSGALSVTGPITLFNGAGLYKGIAGTVKITETFAFVLPTFTSGAKKGQCNESNSANPIAQYSSITGTGTVKFS